MEFTRHKIGMSKIFDMPINYNIPCKLYKDINTENLRLYFPQVFIAHFASLHSAF